MNKNLVDVIGNFVSTELDYIEQSNNEIEKLQQENEQLKYRINEAIKKLNRSIKYCTSMWHKSKSCSLALSNYLELLNILEFEGVENETN